MKQLFFYFAFMLTMFFSCSKPEIMHDPYDGLSKATRYAINGNSIQEVKQSYDLLQNYEKQKLWECKWNAILSNDGKKLSPDQKKIILMIRDFALGRTVEGLYAHPEEGDLFLRKNLPYFEKHFSQKQLFLLIEYPYFCKGFSILKTDQYITSIAEKQNVSCTCYYSISCYLDNYTVCIDGNCTRETGCGIMGSSNCSGTCQ